MDEMKELKCISCKLVKPFTEFEQISEPKKHHNGRRKNCNKCFKYLIWCDVHDQEKSKRKSSNGSYAYRCSKCEYERRITKKENRIKEALSLTGDKLDSFNGFIYLYRCNELDCFKIGITTRDPREYAREKSRDYGLKLELVAFISSPIKAYDAEWLATKAYKGKMVDYTKPCGGKARELFKCGFIGALRRLKTISNKMHLVENPFISLEDIGAIELDTISIDKVNKQRESIRRNDIIARKILRAQAKTKQWCIKNEHGINKSSCCCAQVLDKRYISECKNNKLLEAIKEGRERKMSKVIFLSYVG